MLRYAMLMFLPAVFLLGPSTNARAEIGDDLSGGYVNRSNGGECSISRQGRSYVFINENGTQARFVFDSPNSLRMVEGGWDPRTRATVQGRDRSGRMVIRFDSTGRPGFWVQEN